MELNSYQKKVIGNLKSYLDFLDQSNNLKEAWVNYWEEQDVQIGLGGVPLYNNVISGVPHISFKVPTGGGKTFLACSSLKEIFEEMPSNKPKLVVWLVPSDAILVQTINALSDVNHPYRKKIDMDFSGRVGVYTKDMLLNGENFSPDTVREMLTICVLSYGSLRIGSTKKDVRKVYQENGNLLRFSESFEERDVLLADTPETALIQVLRKLSPVTIVDESHNAGSTLSIEMLKNLNPSFILDLTATPKKSSNVISYVDARELKKENMVKLPVVVYNRTTRQSVIEDAIQLRGNLEQQAIEEEKKNGRYIRPIVLFQAQPQINEDSETFGKIKNMLIEIGIPTEQIAIKTSKIDEIGNIDLLAKDCPIRYIITVNALKEGWDCSFAYILASLANKTSKIDVEQVLGRILRQPYAQKNESPLLNTSYVLTCSNDFHSTLENIVSGLNNAGFSRKDYRIGEGSENNTEVSNSQLEDKKVDSINLLDIEDEISNNQQLSTDSGKTTIDSDLSTNTEAQENISSDLDPEAHHSSDNSISNEGALENDEPEESKVESDSFEDIETEKININIEESKKVEPENIKEMLRDAVTQTEDYESDVEASDELDYTGGEMGQMLNQFKIQPQFEEETFKLRLPQFFLKTVPDLFGEDFSLIEPENLSEGFTLKDQDASISFELSTGDMYKVDVQEEGEAIPKYKRASKIESEFIRDFLTKIPTDSKIKHCTDMLCKQINKHNQYSKTDIADYVKRIISDMKEDEIVTMGTSIPIYAKKIQDKISILEASYREKMFYKWLDSGKIEIKETHEFPKIITPNRSTDSIPKSLYEAERNDLNNFEKSLIDIVVSQENIVWWHRIIERKGFRLNGFINHYPDFIVKTKSGKIILIEAKGDYLDGDDSKRKLKLGRSWASQAGTSYRYFMVFKDKELGLDGSYNLDNFVDIIKEL